MISLLIKQLFQPAAFCEMEITLCNLVYLHWFSRAEKHLQFEVGAEAWLLIPSKFPRLTAPHLVRNMIRFSMKQPLYLHANQLCSPC